MSAQSIENSKRKKNSNDFVRTTDHNKLSTNDAYLCNNHCLKSMIRTEQISRKCHRNLTKTLNYDESELKFNKIIW